MNQQYAQHRSARPTAPARFIASATFALSLLSASAALAQSYVPSVVTTATTTLFTNGTVSIAPGQVAVDKAGNVFYINHATNALYEIPAASPVVTNTAPVQLITAIGQYNSNGVTVDPKGNLWVANGNGSASVNGSTVYVGFVEIPAGTNGIPNTAGLSATPLATVAATTCSATSTAPCVWADNQFATNLTGYYAQPSALTIDAAGNVYFVDYYDNNSTTANRIVKFSIASPSTGTLLASSLTQNNDATLALDGAGNLYYADSPTGGGNGKVSLVTGGALTSVGTTAALTNALIPMATGVSSDVFGNLYISGTNNSSANQISEVPFEGAALNFVDQFGIISGLSNTLTFGGSLDVNGNFYYASYTNVVQTQINGYNFGSVPVGTSASPSSIIPAPSLSLYINVQQAGVSSYFPTGSPTTNTTAAYLQSFPFSGTKSFSGGATLAAGSVNTVTMNFQPIHPGLLKGSFTPRSSGVDDTIVNLQGNGTGPEPLFLPGTPSLLFSAAATNKNLVLPQGLAVDSFGDIFVTDTGNGKVVADCLPTTTPNEDGTGGSTANTFCAVSGYTGAVTQLGTGFISPVGIALDGAQGLYVLDSASTGTPVTFINGQTLTSSSLVAATTTFAGTTLSGPLGIAVDGYANIFIADTGNNRVVIAHQFGATATNNIVYIPSTTNFAGTKLSGPTGLAVDAAQNLYIADTGNNRIVEYSTAGVASVVGTGSITLSAPRSVAVYPSGQLVVTDANAVYLISGSASQALSFGASYLTAGAKGVALDATGNIYLANTSGNQVLSLNLNAPQALAFPSTNAGSTSPATTTQVVNAGNAAAVLTALSSNSTNFTLTPASTCNSTSTIAAAGACTLVTTFTPAAGASGALTASVTLTDNQLSYTLNTTTSNETASFASTGSQSLNLSGTATSNKTAQTISFTPVSTPVTYGSTTTVALAGTASSGLPVTFSVLSGPGTVSGATLAITGAGTIVLAADQAGNTTYAAAPEATQNLVVNPAAQTIAFTVTTPVQYSTTPITLAATGGSSGNPVTFSIVSGNATLSGNTLTLTGVGNVVIAANQAASANYAAAPQVTQTIVVNPASQTITFTPVASPIVFNTNPITLTASSTSGLAAAFSVVSGPATLNGSTLTLTGVGTLVVAANQAGNSLYAAAPQVTQNIVVTPIAIAATPVFTLTTGLYYTTQVVFITDTTPGATIYYTTDGSAPTITSQVYSARTAKNGLTVSSTETLNAIAVATGYTNSVVGSTTLTITQTAPTLGLTLNPTSLSIARGQTGTLMVTMAPANGETATITLGCTGLPPGSFCSFSPATVTTTPAQTPVTSPSP